MAGLQRLVADAIVFHPGFEPLEVGVELAHLGVEIIPLTGEGFEALGDGETSPQCRPGGVVVARVDRAGRAALKLVELRPRFAREQFKAVTVGGQISNTAAGLIHQVELLPVRLFNGLDGVGGLLLGSGPVGPDDAGNAAAN
nr:hypothetical protein [Arthrobacter sp. TB 23]